MPNSLSRLGHMIFQRRESLTLSQDRLSEVAGVTRHTLLEIEKGSGNPTFDTFDKLLEVLGLELTIQEINSGMPHFIPVNK